MPQSDDSRDRLEERDWEMWQAYVKGATQREIGEQFGLSQGAVSLRLKAVRESIPPEEKDLLVQRNLDLIAGMKAELVKLALDGPIPAYSNGRRMTFPDPADPDEPGEPVWDHSPRLAAMDRLHKFMEREAKYTGLDSAEKVEMAATVSRPQEVLDLLAAERARVEAEEAALREGRRREEADAREEYGPA